MKDFNGVEINIGDEVFFVHKPSIVVIGKVSEFDGKKSFTVNYGDVIKISKKGESEIEDYKKANPDDIVLDCIGFSVKADSCVVINAT